MQRSVIIDGRTVTINVGQKSPVLWVASGEYMGEFHSAENRSPASAAARWRNWATM